LWTERSTPLKSVGGPKRETLGKGKKQECVLVLESGKIKGQRCKNFRGKHEKDQTG